MRYEPIVQGKACMRKGPSSIDTNNSATEMCNSLQAEWQKFIQCCWIHLLLACSMNIV